MIDLVLGDCMEILPTLEAKSVHCVVTSPPYWGLRDYGLPPLAWDGDTECVHEWGEQGERISSGGLVSETVGSGKGQGTNTGSLFSASTGQFCHLCNAWRGCLGLEPTPDLYVEHLVSVFREMRRVMRDDATLWLNLGDSYAGSWGNSGHRPELDKTLSHQREKNTEYWNRGGWDNRRDRPPGSYKLLGLKPKDLVGIPWRVALALQADGWWLRSDIIWHKPNCMPESVRDRPTKSHEYIFLLSKSARYWYDADAIREPFADKRMGNPGKYNKLSAAERKVVNERQDLGFLNNGGGWERGSVLGGRNKRTVWTIPTRPFKGAHFAVFPPALIEPCILAGCPVGGTVLDPFGGSGTVGEVALEYNRNAIIIDLNSDYLELAKRRVSKVQMRLT